MPVAEKVFNALAPYDCLLCTTEGQLVCDWCWPEAFEVIPRRCFICRSSTPHGEVCSSCRPGVFLDHVWVITPYRRAAKVLVRRMKIHAQRQACQLIARAMHESAPHISGVVVTSVPTAAARIRERGFDHGRLIAEEFAHLRQLPYRQLLVRLGRAKQAGASRAERQTQIKGVYQPRGSTDIKGLSVLLIDDVTTTGATMIEVAKVLRRAGAVMVNGLVFAQTVA